MFEKPTKVFPCDCMGEGIAVTSSDLFDEEEGEILVSEDKRLRDCQGAPFIEFSFWEFGHPTHGRWGIWDRLRMAYHVFKHKSPWPDMVIMEAKKAKSFANHVLYVISKVEKEIKQPPLVKEE